VPGCFPWELGSTRSSGPALSLPVALLASRRVYLPHLTNGSPSWVLDGVSRPNCRGELLLWPSAQQGSLHFGTSAHPPDPRVYEPGRRPSGGEGGRTPTLDMTSWASICIFRSRSPPVGCLRPPHSLFKGPERSERTRCCLPAPRSPRPPALGCCAPCNPEPGERDGGVRAAAVGHRSLKAEGCGGWGRLCGDIRSAGGAAGYSVLGSPTEQHLGTPRWVAPALERTRLPSEHLRFIPQSFPSGKRSLGCFLVVWKVAPVKAGRKEPKYASANSAGKGLHQREGAVCLGQDLLVPRRWGGCGGELSPPTAGCCGLGLQALLPLSRSLAERRWCWKP